LHDPLHDRQRDFLPAAATRKGGFTRVGDGRNGLKQPSEAAYIAMGLRVLPPGMVGILMAAMLASSMASLSAHNHIITGSSLRIFIRVICARMHPTGTC